MESPLQAQLDGKAARNGASSPYPWLKSYPANVDWFQQFTPTPLPSLLDNAAARFGERPATSFFGQTMTYAELAHQVNRAAKGLQALGVGKGTRVGLLFPNCPAFVVYYYAILKAGGTVVNFNPLYSIPELTHQAKDAEAEIMVTLDLKATFPKAKALLDAGVLKHVVVVPFADMLPGLKSVLFRIFKRSEAASLARRRRHRLLARTCRTMTAASTLPRSIRAMSRFSSIPAGPRARPRARCSRMPTFPSMCSKAMPGFGDLARRRRGTLFLRHPLLPCPSP